MEKTWPPLKDCPQLFLIHHLVDKRKWKDEEFSHYSSDDDKEYYETWKRFLHEVPTSRGYDVDCVPYSEPTPPFETPFCPWPSDVDPGTSPILNKLMGLVIDYISWKTGKVYEKVSV